MSDKSSKRLSSNERKIVLRELFIYLKPYRACIFVSFLMALLSVSLNVLFPLLTGEAVNAIEAKNPLLFYRLVLLMVLTALFSFFFQYVMGLMNNRVTYSVSRDMREVAFNHIQFLSLSYLDLHPHGDIVSKIVTDVEQISDGILMGFTQLFTGVLTILSTLIALFLINWVVALVVLFLTPISLLLAAFISGRTYRLFSSLSKKRGEETAFIDEMVKGAREVELFSMEKRSDEKFEKIDKDWARLSLFSTFYSSLVNPSTRFINSVVYSLVALSGGLSALFGGLSVGALTATLTYASQYARPFNEISGVLTELQNALSSASRLFNLVKEKEETPDSEDSLDIKGRGRVEINDVSFSYVKRKSFIEGLNLKAESGERIAIVGPTGCGKTTIINLLMRFYDVDKGSIELDGFDIRTLKRRALRSSFGMVLQDTWIKSASVRDNIAMGRPDASLDEVREVAKKCHIDHFIETLKDGYDEMISDDTGSLSQGQKQLLSIARAMIVNPNMLILDEATSSIDTRTEALISSAFDSLMKGKTSFIVAHRLSTIKSADLILVMRDGKIVERGNHRELIEKRGFYYELYNSQFPERED